MEKLIPGSRLDKRFEQRAEEIRIASIVKLDPLAPHPVQSHVYRDPVRFKVVPAGRRSGKTELCKRITLREMCRFDLGPDRRYFVAAPVLHQTRRVYWQWFKRHTPKMLVMRIHESTSRIELVDGTELHLLGMDVPERIEGVPWDGGVLDEFGNMKARAWIEHVRPALVDRNGWCILTGVPEGRNHYWDVWQEAQKQGGPDWGGYTWTSASVLPLYGRGDEVEAARRDLDPRTFRQEMEASFEEAVGRIFYNFDRKLDVHEFPFDPKVGTRDDYPWLGGMDFNVMPMTAVWGWETEKLTSSGETEQHIYVWDELSVEARSNTTEAAQRIRERCENGRPELGRDGTDHPYAGHVFNHFVMHPDPTGRAEHTNAPAGRTDITILKDSGFRVSTRSHSPTRRDKYNSVNCMFLNGVGSRRVHIHPRCKQLIRCLEGLLYEQGTSAPDLKRCEGMDHITDAFAYWVERRHRPGSGPIEVRKY